jgi:hypothetical protein
VIEPECMDADIEGGDGSDSESKEGVLVER